MKQGWERKELETVTKRIFAGGDKPKNFSETITDTLKIPVYANGVSNNGLCGYTDTSTVTDNCITVSARGTIGFCCIRIEPFVPIVRLIVIIPNDNIVVKYLYYAIKHSKIDNSGTSIPQLTVPMIRNISIPVPSLAEQERIVEILDREFERIDALKANAEQNLQHAKDLFQSALKQELQPKEGWETKILKQIGNTQTGTTPKTANKDYYGSYIPFIKPADVNIDGLGGLNYANERLSKLGASAGRVFDANSILMVCIGATIGKVGYADRQVSSNQQINVLTPHNSFNSKYLYYYMTSSGFQHMVIREGESAKATLPIINKSKWENLSISYPCKEIQDEIVSRLDELNKHCKALEENYRKAITLCDDMKQALLRKAFNGEL